MALPVMPHKISSYGKRRIRFVDVFADNSEPTAEEMNAGDVIACFVRNDAAGPTSIPNKVQVALGLCETEQNEAFGITINSHPDLTLFYDPQGAPGSDGKTAWDLLYNDGDGYQGNLVWELGFVVDADTDTDVTNGDRVTVVPVDVRVISEEPTEAGEAGLFAFQVAIAVTGPIKRNVAVGGDES